MKKTAEFILLDINEIKFLQAELNLIKDHLKDLEKNKVMILEEDDCNVKYGIDFLFNHQHKAFRLPAIK